VEKVQEEPEKAVKSRDVTTSTSEVEKGELRYERKTYWQKLSVIDKKRPNRMLDILVAPFKGFTYPVVSEESRIPLFDAH
jgi:hypothetical protein